MSSLMSLRSILRSNAQAPDESNPGSGDVDFLWAAVVMGLCSVVCVVSLLRKGGRA